MTSFEQRTSQFQGSQLPIALLYAQDVHWAQPIREYLEQNGCKVIINRSISNSPTYAICVGDTNFVKSFFEHPHVAPVKKLAIIYEGNEMELHSLKKHNVKQYYIDPISLNMSAVQAIFAFFFTSGEYCINARKEPNAPKKNSVIPREPSREPTIDLSHQEASDKSRVDREMQQIYKRKNGHASRWYFGDTTTRWKFFLSFFFISMFPFALYVLSLLASIIFLATSVKTLTDGKTHWIPLFSSLSDSYLKTSQGVLSICSPVLVFFGLGETVGDNERLLSVLSQSMAAQKGVVHIYETSALVAGGILFPNTATKKAGVSDVLNLSTEVSRVSQHLALISAQLTSLTQASRFPFNTSQARAFLNNGNVKLTALRNVVGYTDKLLALYPRMGGFKKKQTYLVLLQNSMEIRPTGGFIGSLLKLTFMDGKVDALEVLDVYTADGQLKGHVDPPLPIREILGQEHWYLRDSNWDPDFEISGRQAAWFYEKELGEQVDGVIAISLPLVTAMLRVTGPIELLDFNERISESNFYAKSLLYTETDFFPGSTQKKDFLGALISALLTKITTDASLSTGSLLTVLTESIQSRDLQFYFPDEELQALVSQWGWDGGLDIQSCYTAVQNVPCVGDGFGIVEANLGVNKVNFFIQKEGSDHISILENGDIEHRITITTRNTAPLVESGAGSYQNYMRIYVPSDAQVRSVSLDGAVVPKRDINNPVPPPAPYWYIEQSMPFRIIHFPFATAPRQTRQLMVHWVRPAVINSNSEGVYHLTMRKQPGTPPSSWHLRITHPTQWRAIHEPDVAKGGVLEYNTDLARDFLIRVPFRKNL